MTQTAMDSLNTILRYTEALTDNIDDYTPRLREYTPNAAVAFYEKASQGGKVVQKQVGKALAAFYSPTRGGKRSRENYFDMLPDELVLHLMRDHMNVIDVVQLSGTCRRMYDLGSDHILWRAFYSSTWGSLGTTAHLVTNWKYAFKCKVETELNWKYGRCQVTPLEHDTSGNESFVKLADPLLIVVNSQGTGSVYNVHTLQCVIKIDVGREVAGIDFDGRRVILATGNNVCMYSIFTRKCTQIFEGHTDLVTCVRLLGERAVSGAFDGTVRVWDVDSGRCLHVLVHSAQGYVSCLDVDGDLIVSGSRNDRVVKVWSAVAGSELGLIELKRGVTCLHLEGYQLIVSLAGCLKMEVWSVLPQTRKTKTLNVMEKCHVSVLMCKKERLLAASGDMLSVYDTACVTLINFGSDIGFGVSVPRAFGSEIEPLYSLSGHDDRITSLCFDEWRAVSASASGIKVWNFSPLLAVLPTDESECSEIEELIESGPDTPTPSTPVGSFPKRRSSSVNRKQSPHHAPNAPQQLPVTFFARFSLFMFLWYRWIAYEAGAEYTYADANARLLIRKWVRSTLVWLPLTLPALFLTGLSHHMPEVVRYSPPVYWLLSISLLIPWVAHSLPRPTAIKRWKFAFPVLEFALVVVAIYIESELCPRERHMWQLFVVVSTGYSVSKGLLHIAKVTLQSSRRHEMHTTLFYTPLIGMAAGVAFVKEGVRGAVLVMFSITFSFLFDATGGATGDNADNIVTLFAASVLGIACPFAADIIFTVVDFFAYSLITSVVDSPHLTKWWEIYIADSRHGYPPTYIRLMFFFVSGCATLTFIKYIRNGARFHKYRAPLVRLSFWVYLTLLTYTFYEMVRHKLG